MTADELRAAATAWLAVDPDPTTRGQVEAMLAADDVDALREHFSITLAFGTGGMRGPMGPGTARMNRRIVRRVTAALAEVWLEQVDDAATRGVVVGYDARHHSRTFAEDTAAVLAARGFVVHLADAPVPTPLVGFATMALGAAAGVVITASHNPPADNGYKVFGPEGAQIVPPLDTAIQDRMAATDTPIDAPAFGDRVRLWPPTLIDDYHAAIAALRVHRGGRATVVYTPVHGVGGQFVERALREAGHTVHVVAAQAQPDGDFPTVTFPNPEEPGVLDLAKRLADEVGAQAIIANDPDADRCAVAVPSAEGWVQLSGNELGVLLADDLLAAQPVGPGDLVATTIVSTAMTAAVARAHGVAYAEALTGFKWIATLGLEHEARGGRFLFGFEESIGYAAGTVVRDKDGVSTALLVADLVAEVAARGETLRGRLDGLARRHGAHTGRQVSRRLPGTEGMAQIATAMHALRTARPTALAGRRVVAIRDLLQQRGARADGTTFPIDLPASDVVAFDLEGGSRVLVRPSGTEPKIKLYLEVVDTVPEGGTVAGTREAAAAGLDALQAEVWGLAGLG